MQVRLHTIVLSERATAVGKSVQSIRLAETGADVHAIRRDRQRLALAENMILQAGDVIVVRGTSEAVARAEQRLLK
jgi:CPA2 family monovalent cation:H+ antiporter-2